MGKKTVSCTSCRALFPRTRNPAGRPDQSRILVRCPDCRERARRYVQELGERWRRAVELREATTHNVYFWAIADRKTGSLAAHDRGLYRGTPELYEDKKSAKEICGKRGRVVRLLMLRSPES